jgi:hypothetical protein
MVSPRQSERPGNGEEDRGGGRDFGRKRVNYPSLKDRGFVEN